MSLSHIAAWVIKLVL